MTCYDLIKEKRWEEAVEQADKDFSETGNVLHLNNKVKVLLLIGEYSKAVDLAEELSKKSRTDNEVIYSGIGLWLLGEREKAIDKWKSGLDADYSDAAGGITIPSLLFFASIFMKSDSLMNEAKKRIEKIMKNKESQNFPGIIGLVLLGREDAVAVLEKEMALSGSDTMKNRKKCKILFYHLVILHRESKTDDFSKYLNEVIGTEAYLEPEYFLAFGLMKQDAIFDLA